MNKFIEKNLDVVMFFSCLGVFIIEIIIIYQLIKNNQ
jgi:hypothetical protein